MKIVLTGGDSGGHIFPLIAVSKKIKEKFLDAEFMFIGPKGKMEDKIIGGDENINIKNILTGKFRRYFSFLNFVDAIKMPIGIIQALWYLLWFMPDAIFSKGGGASLPVVVAGWLYRIPILIHESDSKPGLANLILSKFADRVAISYLSAQNYFIPGRTVLTGIPLRLDIVNGDAKKAREFFSLTESKKTIFVFGGSQGAKKINDAIMDILPELHKKYQIIHQTGENNFEEVKKKAGEEGFKVGHDGYYPVPFIGEELKDVLAISDLVISRAGGNSIAEIAAVGKPAILIPIEKSANNHQNINAYNVSEAGGCIVLEENNLGDILKMKIDEIMENEEERKKLSENIKKFYYPDAAEKIAEGIIGMIK